MMIRCFIGVDDVVVGVKELPVAVPAKDITDVKNPDSSMNGIKSARDICSILLTEDICSILLTEDICSILLTEDISKEYS